MVPMPHFERQGIKIPKRKSASGIESQFGCFSITPFDVGFKFSKKNERLGLKSGDRRQKSGVGRQKILDVMAGLLTETE